MTSLLVWGTSPDLLQSYLTEQWWQLKNVGQNIFEHFLSDVQIYSSE